MIKTKKIRRSRRLHDSWLSLKVVPHGLIFPTPATILVVLLILFPLLGVLLDLDGLTLLRPAISLLDLLTCFPLVGGLFLRNGLTHRRPATILYY